MTLERPLSSESIDRMRGCWGREPDDATLLGSAVDASGEIRVGWAPDFRFLCEFAELPIDVLLAQVVEMTTHAKLPIAPSAGFHLNVGAQEFYYWGAEPFHSRPRIEALEQSEGWKRRHLDRELDGHLALLGDSCVVGRQVQRERWMEMARRFLWLNEVDAYQSCWSQRNAIELDAQDWPVAPDVAHTHFLTVLDRLGVTGPTIDQELLRLPASGSQQTPVSYCARVYADFGKARNAKDG